MSDQVIEFLQQLINGLSQGAIYALIALGYTMADTAVFHPEAAEEHFEELRGLFGRTLH